MDDRAGDVFCGADRDFEKQGKYVASFFGTGGTGRHLDLRHESIFFVAKSYFYYSVKSAYGFDMRISGNSGGFIAFLYSDFEHDINISQK